MGARLTPAAYAYGLSGLLPVVVSGSTDSVGVMMAALAPTLSVEEVHIDQLRPDPANPRRISEDELEALTRSLRQWGFVQPVVARREDGVVIGGHQRLVAARRLGITAVPVSWLDISAEQARLLGLALNKISGSRDEQLLARLLARRHASGGPRNQPHGPST